MVGWVSGCVSPSVRESVCPSRFALWTRYRLQFLPDQFQTSHVNCSWWEEEPYWFGITRSNFKVNIGPPARECHALRCLVCVAPFMAVDTCIQPRAVEDHNIELTKVWKLNSKALKALAREQAIFFFNVPSFPSKVRTL